MRRTLAALLAALTLLMGGSAHAQERVANFALLYDLDSTDPLYCRVTGENGDAFAGPIPVAARLITDGSNATVTELTSGTNPFVGIAVNDVLVVNTGDDTTKFGVVTAKASDASLTIHTARNWDNSDAGYKFGYLKTSCGTSATSGWIEIPAGFTERNITLQIDQEDGITGGINVRWECKDGYQNAKAIRVYPTTSSTDCGSGTLSSGYCNYTAETSTTGGFTVQVVEPRRSCRVSLDIGTSETAESQESHNERITVGLHLTTPGK